MILTVTTEPAPLETNADGVVRVGKTRVTLDTVVAVFKQGATAEEIVSRYPSLKLADVYATIGFYQKNGYKAPSFTSASFTVSSSTSSL